MKNLYCYHLFYLIFILSGQITAQNIDLKADSVKVAGKIFQVGSKGILLDQISPEAFIPTNIFYSTPIRQTFLAGFSGKLTKIEVFFDATFDPSFTLKILGSAGNILATEDFVQAFGLNTYVFSNPISVIAGQQYIMEFSKADLIHISVNGYSGGEFSHLNGMNFEISQNLDIVFNTYISVDFGLKVDQVGNIFTNGLISQKNIAGPFNSANQLLKLDGNNNLSLFGQGILAKNTFGQVEIGFPGNLNSSIELRNYSAGTPFIDFSNNALDDFDARLILAGNENLQLQGANLQVINGSVSALGFNNTSDFRFKTNFSEIQNPLDKVLKMKGLNYFWKQKEFPERKFTAEKQIGFIAQDLEKILPEVVFTDGKGYKSVDYAKVVPMLVEAIKVQNKLILNLKKDFEKLKPQIK